MTFLFISFIAGVLTILAPCILPLLPVIVGHSISDATPSKRRLLVVVTSLSFSIILFTLILKVSTLFVDIPQDFWKWISGGIIFFFGLTMIFPSIWERFSLANTLSMKSNQVLTKGYQKDSIWGDVIIGASLGPIFSACSPTYFVILATVLPVSLFLGIVYLLAYVLGLSLSLVLIALLGEGIMARVGKVSDPRGWFKKIFGVIFILVAVGIITGYDKKLQISLLDAGFFDVTKVEQKLLDNSQSKNVEDDTSVVNDENVSTEDVILDKSETIKENRNEKFLTLAEKSKKYILAPDISTPDGFINTNGLPITIAGYKGKKVVLLDIWTYSCINCQRTIPYLNQWYKSYEDDGLVIIGLHTPEFSFERVQKNVEEAVKDFNIKYPVVLDNDFSTWEAYKNQYWPRKYLIDIDGYIVYDHAGEGEYKETEVAIQKALREKSARLGENMNIGTSTSVVSPIAVDFGKVKSPEIYFGAFRNADLANGTVYKVGSQTLVVPEEIEKNKLYLNGTWNITTELAESVGGDIIFEYEAKNVYMVASSLLGADVEVYVDGKLHKNIHIKNETLYKIVEGSSYGEHVLKIKIKSGTLKAFTFTFG
jgi:cytochrome c biogenesis protein CcdA/thiol-disulfide isomerase/thioredoxin